MSSFLILNNQVFHIQKTPLSIGRSLDNNFVLQDASVSRMHAEIHFKNDQYSLIDLNSSAGTFLNSVRIEEPMVLKSGDSIIIATIPIIFAQNAPQLQKKAKKPTGPLKTPKGHTTEPTVLDSMPDWRPKE